MDIKTLLLKSLYLKEPISGCYRINFGKSCYILRYVVKGKILRISSIKSTKKSKTWTHRIRQQNGFYINQWRRQKKKITKNFSHSKEIQKEVKTLDQANIASIVRTTSTQCPIKVVTTSAQQTIPSIRYNLIKIKETEKLTKIEKMTKSCQTELNSDSKGIQCKHDISYNGTQTDKNLRNSTTQTQIDSFSAGKCEKFVQTNDCFSQSVNIKDVDIIIYMLNEIGERVTDQNVILKNTSQILKYVRQINHLEKIIASRNSFRRRRQEYTKTFKQNKNTLKAHSSSASVMPTQTSNKFVQTNEAPCPKTVSASTQTVATFYKPRKLSFLKKAKS